ncbi:MAG: SH3 domain-containing protein [Myxococcota bacterium]
MANVFTWIPGLLVVASALGAEGCCKETSSEGTAAPPAQSVAVDEPIARPPPTPSVAPAHAQNDRHPTATIAAPPSRYGTPRRGIVRASPSFRADEVERLDNGTTVRILERRPGGWSKIRWDTGGGVDEGWIHTDVVKE